MSDNWQVFGTCPDAVSAALVAGLLRSEGVPVLTSANEPVPGLVEAVRLLVPAGLLHRARWVATREKLSEAELTFLATGELLAGEGEAE